jgi:hypothetical protein
MNEPLDTKARTLVALLSIVALAFLAGDSLHAQGSQPMKTFVILFRQGSRTLTEADLKNRTEETRAWARAQNAAGHKLDPRILAPEGQWIGPDGGGPVPVPEAGQVTAILFLEAGDLGSAVDIARAHPATRYGSSVEVRPWAPPPSPPPAAGSSGEL